MDLSIQIVNYNTKKYLVDCIRDIISDIKDPLLEYEILVLDNSSRDDLSDLEFPNTKFFKSEKNGGFGYGHNVLSENGSGEYILILNPDIKFHEEKTIERLLLSLKNHETREFCAIGPKLLTRNNLPQAYDHGELYGILPWLIHKMGGTYWRNSDESKEVSWVSGACFLIKRKDFEGIGKFDENFFLYKEEEDLFLRLRKEGRKVFYEPNIKLIHYGSVVASKDKYMQASKDYFKKKHSK